MLHRRGTICQSFVLNSTFNLILLSCLFSLLGDIFFYETGSVKKDSHPIVWILINFQHPLKLNKSVVQSTKILVQVFCKDRSIRELANFEYSGFNGQGKLIRSNESGGPWTPAAKETPEEDIYKILCS